MSSLVTCGNPGSTFVLRMRILISAIALCAVYHCETWQTENSSLPMLTNELSFVIHSLWTKTNFEYFKRISIPFGRRISTFWRPFNISILDTFGVNPRRHVVTCWNVERVPSHVGKKYSFNFFKILKWILVTYHFPVLPSAYHTEDWRKLSKICRQHFQTHFLSQTIQDKLFTLFLITVTS